MLSRDLQQLLFVKGITAVIFFVLSAFVVWPLRELYRRRGIPFSAAVLGIVALVVASFSAEGAYGVAQTLHLLPGKEHVPRGAKLPVMDWLALVFSVGMALVLLVIGLRAWLSVRSYYRTGSIETASGDTPSGLGGEPLAG